MQTDSTAEVTGESLPWRYANAAIIGMTVVGLIGVCIYLFSQVPLLLWEITIGFFLGSMALRLVSLAANNIFR
jgi:hypothetical protein